MSVRISTGEVTIEDYIVVHDCGTVINPPLVEGQIHGGVAQGIAGAMYEHFQYDPDTPTRGSLRSWTTWCRRARRSRTWTSITSSRPHQTSLWESRAAVREARSGPPAVVIGAVSDALSEWGVDLTECPVTPVAVRAALRGAGALGDAAAGVP